MTWTDIHAHLSDLDADALAETVGEAVSAGVGMIINNALSLDSSKTVIDQCRRFPMNMRAAVGISPFDTAGTNDDWADQLGSLLTDPAAAAIGEMGLDCTNPRYPPLDIQMPFFIKQLEIAIASDLPVIVHSRGMEKRTAEICNDVGTSKAIFHCFTGDMDAMEYIIAHGYYISISGIITYKNSHLPELVRRVPLDKLLIETDAPYLSPAPHRGKVNRPAYLTHTARAVADIIEVDIHELSSILNNNADRIFTR